MKKEFLKVQKFIPVVTMLIFIFSLSTAQLARAAENPTVQTLPSFADLADKVKDSVVNIATTQEVEGNPLVPFLGQGSPFGDFFGKDMPKRFFNNRPQSKMKTHALGSGFVISKEGLILTNNHVVEKATEIKIKLMNGKEYDARLVGRDPKTDLALIRVTP